MSYLCDACATCYLSYSLWLTACVSEVMKYWGSAFLMCVSCIPNAYCNWCTHLGGARLYFDHQCHTPYSLLIYLVQIVCCHQYTKKGEIDRAYFPLIGFSD